MSDAAIVPESSTGGDNSAILESLSPVDYQTWLDKGELPEPKPADSAPASEPSEPKPGEAATTPAEVKSAPASEPAKDDAKGKGLKARHTELDAEIASLHDKLRERRRLQAELSEPGEMKGDKKPAPSPSAAQDDPSDPKPLLKTFLDSAKSYEEAVEQHAEALTDWKLRRAESARTQSAAASAAREAQEQFDRKVLEDSVTLADFDAVIDGSAGLKLTQAMDAYISQSEHPGLLLYHLALPKNRAEFHRISGLAPVQAVLALEAMQAGLVNGKPASGATAQPSAKPAAAQPKAPAEPPVDIASRTGIVPDDETQAVSDGDFTRFEKAANLREFARR